MSVKYKHSPYYTTVTFSSFGELRNKLKHAGGKRFLVVDANVLSLYGEALHKAGLLPEVNCAETEETPFNTDSKTINSAPIPLKEQAQCPVRTDSPHNTLDSATIPLRGQAQCPVPTDSPPPLASFRPPLPLIPVQAGIHTPHLYPFKAEETNKTFTETEKLLNHLSSANLSRKDYVIAIGGGITTDITGFAASIYKRGCRLLFIPTTFTAMIDAAIGGKNGVNYQTAGSPLIIKNLLGSFYPAQEVIICPEFLKTLEDKEMLNGWAECIKVSLLLPNQLYRDILKHLRDNAHSPTAKYPPPSKNIIRDALRLKEKLCRNDLYDKSERRKLNLGHTFAHLIETASEFAVPHGVAVALGIRAAACYSLKNNRIDEPTFKKIVAPLELLNFPEGLPTEYKQCIAEQGEKIIAQDKKKASHHKLVLFSGFQNTRVVSIEDSGEVVSTLLKL